LYIFASFQLPKLSVGKMLKSYFSHQRRLHVCFFKLN